MRITANTIYRDSTATIERTSENLLDFQRQVASGKRIEKPSDDPSAIARAIVDRNELAATEQYQRTSDSVTSRLTVIDTALSDVVNRLTEAQSAAMNGRGTNKTQAQREAAAQALEGVKQALFEDLNTSFQGVYVFAGTDTASPPFTMGPGNVVSGYQGNAQQVNIDIDQGRAVGITLDGSALSQGSAATDIFTDLDNLIAAVRAGIEPNITTGMAALQSAFDRATATQTRVGTSLASIETQQAALDDRRLANKTRISKNEDANMAEAIANMSQAEAAYNTALQATAKLAQRSLMDYLS